MIKKTKTFSLNVNGKIITFDTDLEEHIDFNNNENFAFCEEKIAECLQDYIDIFGVFPPRKHIFYISQNNEEETFVMIQIKDFNSFNDCKNHFLIFLKALDITDNLGQLTSIWK